MRFPPWNAAVPTKSPPPAAQRWLRNLALHPRLWRERYGEEFTALLEDSPMTARTVIEVATHALGAQAKAHVNGLLLIAALIVSMSCHPALRLTGLTANILWAPSDLARGALLAGILVPWAHRKSGPPVKTTNGGLLHARNRMTARLRPVSSRPQPLQVAATVIRPSFHLHGRPVPGRGGHVTRGREGPMWITEGGAWDTSSGRRGTRSACDCGGACDLQP